MGVSLEHLARTIYGHDWLALTDAERLVYLEAAKRVTSQYDVTSRPALSDQTVADAARRGYYEGDKR